MSGCAVVIVSLVKRESDCVAVAVAAYGDSSVGIRRELFAQVNR